jgi:hypothetical protein
MYYVVSIILIPLVTHVDRQQIGCLAVREGKLAASVFDVEFMCHEITKQVNDRIQH